MHAAGIRTDSRTRAAYAAVVAMCLYGLPSVFLSRIVLVGGVLSVSVETGVVVPVVLMSGWPGAIGVVLAEVLTGITTSGGGVSKSIEVGLMTAVALAGRRRLYTGERVPSGSPERWTVRERIVRTFDRVAVPFIALTLGAASAAAAFAAWLSFLLWSTPFAPVAISRFVEYTVATLVVSPVVATAAALVGSSGSVVGRTQQPSDPTTKWSVGRIASAWLVFGTVWGVGFGVAERGLETFRQLLPPPLPGSQAAVATVSDVGQAGIGGFIFVLLAVVIVRTISASTETTGPTERGHS